MKVEFKPRPKYLVIRQIKQKQVRGIEMPDITETGVRFVVESVGAKVEGISPGDEIMLMPKCPAIQPDEAPGVFVVKASFVIATISRFVDELDLSV